MEGYICILYQSVVSSQNLKTQNPKGEGLSILFNVIFSTGCQLSIIFCSFYTLSRMNLGYSIKDTVQLKSTLAHTTVIMSITLGQIVNLYNVHIRHLVASVSVTVLHTG